MSITVFKDPAQLSSIIDRIHDRWFEKEEITFDKEKCVLTIPFFERASSLWPFKKKEAARSVGLLKIHCVASYAIRDTEEVGTYDFNELIYAPEAKRLSITTGVPIGIEITITDFEIAVEELQSQEA
jgi:hypothetical protein